MNKELISALNIESREKLAIKLSNDYNTELFIDFWNLTIQMTLFNKNIKVIDDIISKSLNKIFISSGIDYRQLILQAFYDRAIMIFKYSYKIANDNKVREHIFSNRVLNGNIASILLKKIGYLDIVFVKNNINKIKFKGEYYDGIDGIYNEFDDDLEYFSSTQDLDEEGKINALSSFTVTGQLNIRYGLFTYEDYYKELDSEFYLNLQSNNNNIEELILDGDFYGIVEYCKNGTVMGTEQEIASGLYNVGNQVGQYYNNNELAIKLYSESIKYISSDATVYNNLATAYKRLSDFKNAIKYYTLALKYNNDNPIRYLRIAMLYAFIKDEGNAIKYLKDFFNIGGDEILLISTCRNTTEGGDDLLKLYNLI